MTGEDRVQLIIEKIFSLDARFGKPAHLTDYNDAGPNARLITDQPSVWEALIMPEYLSDSVARPDGKPDGKRWDLFQLRVYQSPCVTAHMRDGEILLRLYRPGPWEPIFFCAPLPAIPAVVPGAWR